MSGYENARFSILGDSISTFEGYLPTGYPSYYGPGNAYETGVYRARDTWWGQVLSRVGGELLVNNSWSGSYVCRAPGCEIESYGCSDARTGGLHTEDIAPDHILVFIGTNDRGAGFPLTGDRPCDPSDPSTLAIIENAYSLMLEKLHHNYPRAIIWCCTYPVTTCTRYPDYRFPLTWRGVPTSAYSALVRRIAQSHGCRIIELSEGEPCDTVEGLHPTWAGMKTIADHVIAALEAYDHES